MRRRAGNIPLNVRPGEIRVRHKGIELWGYPGSGKTTISNILKSKAVVDVIDLWDPEQNILAHPIRAYHTMREIQSLREPSARHAVQERNLERLALRQCVSFSGRTRATLIEEGITHEIWRLLFSDPSMVDLLWWRRFLSYAGPIVVVLETSPETACRRIQTKSNPGPLNRELMRHSVESPRWKQAVRAYDEVLHGLTLSSSVEVVRMSVEHTADEACSTLLNFIAERG